MSMWNFNTNDFDDEEDEEDELPRGFIIRPTSDVCPKGHIDWEIVQDMKLGLIKRCRQCGFIDRDFKGQIIE